MRARVIILFVLVVCVTPFMLCCRSESTQPTTESVYDRVIKAGKIRCAYIVYPPGASKDPNTGKLYGISVETVQEAGKNLDLEIEWTEEVGWGSMIEGLESDRYDLVVSGIWPNASRAKLVDFSTPLYYSGIGLYVRQSDNRFPATVGEDGLKNLDTGSIKISTIDGEMSDIIARSQFPNAQRVSLPQISDVSQLLLNVAQGRADLTFVEPYIGNQFLQNNPGTVKNIMEQKPIRIFGNTVMFRRGQTEFKSMLNTAIEELINNGFVDALMDKYEIFPGALYRRSYPYRISAP
jgi:polar amino acid transport system substrate-binding protein